MSGLTWNPMFGVKRPKTPKYAEEAQQDKIEHSQGWPHFDRKGNCICLCKRCMGPAGCICKGCAGRGHANCDKGEYRLTQGEQADRMRA